MPLITGNVSLTDVTGVNQAIVDAAGFIRTSKTSTVAGTTLNAITSLTTGSTIDLAGPAQQVQFVVTAASGVTAGVVQLQVSQDNVNWYIANAAVTATLGLVQFPAVITGVFRYARAVVTTAPIGGGAITVTVMGA